MVLSIKRKFDELEAERQPRIAAYQKSWQEMKKRHKLEKKDLKQRHDSEPQALSKAEPAETPGADVVHALVTKILQQPNKRIVIFSSRDPWAHYLLQQFGEPTKDEAKTATCVTLKSLVPNALLCTNQDGGGDSDLADVETALRNRIQTVVQCELIVPRIGQCSNGHRDQEPSWDPLPATERTQEIEDVQSVDEEETFEDLLHLDELEIPTDLDVVDSETWDLDEVEATGGYDHHWDTVSGQSVLKAICVYLKSAQS